MGRARGRLDQGRLDVGQVLDLEDLALRVGTVLGKAAGEVNAMAGPLGKMES